jgi:hypothetical protein
VDKQVKNWKRNTLIAGALIGSLVGILAAKMLVQEAEKNEGQTAITAKKGMQLGMLVLGLLRQITNL